MARPHKGDRVPVLVRLPRTIADAVSRLDLIDRNAWIVAAVTDKLQKDANHA